MQIDLHVKQLLMQFNLNETWKVPEIFNKTLQNQISSTIFSSSWVVTKSYTAIIIANPLGCQSAWIYNAEFTVKSKTDRSQLGLTSLPDDYTESIMRTLTVNTAGCVVRRLLWACSRYFGIKYLKTKHTDTWKLYNHPSPQQSTVTKSTHPLLFLCFWLGSSLPKNH
jgi:hypothetical protein